MTNQLTIFLQISSYLAKEVSVVVHFSFSDLKPITTSTKVVTIKIANFILKADYNDDKKVYLLLMRIEYLIFVIFRTIPRTVYLYIIFRYLA